MTQITASTLRKRAELVTQGYEQTQNPSASLLEEFAAREFAPGWVDLRPASPGSTTPAGLQVRGYYPPTRELFDVSSRLRSVEVNEATGQAAMSGTFVIDNSDGLASQYMHRPGMTLLMSTRAHPDVPFKERDDGQRRRVLAHQHVVSERLRHVSSAQPGPARARRPVGACKGGVCESRHGCASICTLAATAASTRPPRHRQGCAGGLGERARPMSSRYTRLSTTSPRRFKK